MQKGGIGSHTLPNNGMTNVWLTPRKIIDALGPFDLDPCAAPSPRPWPTAKYHIELPEDGLAASWLGPWCSRCGALDRTRYLPEKVQSCDVCSNPLSYYPQRFRVWLNPPYGRSIDPWLEKMAAHRFGTALIFARTETATWQKLIWPYAEAIFFFEGRLWFHEPDGRRGDSNAGGPSALIAYHHRDILRIEEAEGRGDIKGVLVTEWSTKGSGVRRG